MKPPVLSSIKTDAHKRKLVRFFLPHGVVRDVYGKSVAARLDGGDREQRVVSREASC